MKILLVTPGSEDDYFSTILRQIPYVSAMRGTDSGAVCAPLALVTLAALTPEPHEVTIHDENVRGP